MEFKTRKGVIAAIIEYFTHNDEIFTRCIEELDAWNGYLDDDRYYAMEELAEFESDPIELLNKAYYGRDDDSYTTDSYGEKHYDGFNPNRDYFKYNGYGNLVSTDFPDYSDHIDHWTVEQMTENRSYIDTIDEYDDLAELFDALEELDERETA